MKNAIFIKVERRNKKMIKKPNEIVNTDNKFRVLIAGYPRNRKNNIRFVST